MKVTDILYCEVLGKPNKDNLGHMLGNTRPVMLQLWFGFHDHEDNCPGKQHNIHIVTVPTQNGQ